MDDLRDSRPADETLAIGVALYSALAEHVLRSRGLWSATGKAIPRRLAEHAPELSRRFPRAFSDLFANGDRDAVVELAEEILAATGGPLFEGYHSIAPDTWRISRDHG